MLPAISYRAIAHDLWTLWMLGPRACDDLGRYFPDSATWSLGQVLAIVSVMSHLDDAYSIGCRT